MEVKDGEGYFWAPVASRCVHLCLELFSSLAKSVVLTSNKLVKAGSKNVRMWQDHPEILALPLHSNKQTKWTTSALWLVNLWMSAIHFPLRNRSICQWLGIGMGFDDIGTMNFTSSLHSLYFLTLSVSFCNSIQCQQLWRLFFFLPISLQP